MVATSSQHSVSSKSVPSVVSGLKIWLHPLSLCMHVFIGQYCYGLDIICVIKQKPELSQFLHLKFWLVPCFCLELSYWFGLIFAWKKWCDSFSFVWCLFLQSLLTFNPNTSPGVVGKVQKNCLPKEEGRESGDKSTQQAGAQTSAYRMLGKSPQLPATGVV